MLRSSPRLRRWLEEAGLIRDEEDRDRALTALAAGGGGVEHPKEPEDDDLDKLDMSEEERQILFGVLHKVKAHARVIESKPIDEP